MLVHDYGYVTILHIPGCSDGVTFQLDSLLEVEYMPQCFAVKINTSQQLEIRCPGESQHCLSDVSYGGVKGKFNIMGLA